MSEDPGIRYDDGGSESQVLLEAFLECLCSDSEYAWPILKNVSEHYGTDLALVIHQSPLPYHRHGFFSHSGNPASFAVLGNDSLYSFEGRATGGHCSRVGGRTDPPGCRSTNSLALCCSWLGGRVDGSGAPWSQKDRSQKGIVDSKPVLAVVRSFVLFFVCQAILWFLLLKVTVSLKLLFSV